MRQITTTVYKFEELPNDAAKEKAREWCRRAGEGDNYFAECPTEEFADTLKILGFDVTGGKNQGKRIYWSGFSSQGDGAYFEGSWYASHVEADKVAALIADRPADYERDGKMQHCASNAELDRIASAILEIAAKYPESSGTACNRYRGNNQSADFDTNQDSGMNDDGCAEFSELVRDLAHWFYRTLETEYEYQQSDECIDENIIANEYEFEEDGSRC